MSAAAEPSALRVTARPVFMARIARVTAAVVFAIFIVIAIVQPHDNAGATFGTSDQIGTGVLGVLIAAGILLLTRPRLIADSESVRTRSFAGNYRTIPWDLILGVEFPANARFGRLVLPGEETLALYAVQRADLQHSIAVMRDLRTLFALTHPASGGQGRPRPGGQSVQ